MVEKEVEKVVTEVVEVEKEVEKVVTEVVEKEVVVTEVVEKEVMVEVEPSRAGGELVVRTAEDIENFDTHTDQLQVFRSLIQWTIFEPLVQYDENLNLNGILAESWENPSPEVWRFHLREGVKFHDGSDFTAEDAKYSLDRVQDPDTASWLIGNLANMVKAEVVDDYTLDVTLDGPVASFLDKLTVIGMMPAGFGRPAAPRAGRFGAVQVRRVLGQRACHRRKVRGLLAGRIALPGQDHLPADPRSRGSAGGPGGG